MSSDTQIRDILLPHSDRTVLVQLLVVVGLTLLATYLVRRERALVLLTLGLGSVVLGLMGLRTLH